MKHPIPGTRWRQAGLMPRKSYPSAAKSVRKGLAEMFSINSSISHASPSDPGSSPPSLAHHVLDRDELPARSKDLFGWIERGELEVTIERELPLTDAAAAHGLLGEGRLA